MKLGFPLLIAALAVSCSNAGSDGDNDNTPPPNTCGDGVARGSEQCDDGNTTNGDGCSAMCLLESVGVCGDGMKATNEGCDDGNTMSGDGCSDTCTEETNTGTGTCSAPFTLVLTNNNGDLEGTGTGDTSTSTNQVAESECDGFPSGAGKDHIWKFTLPDPRDVYIMMDDTSAFDTALRVLTSPCDVATEVAEFTGADGCADGEGASEFMGYVALPAGTYYIVVDGYTDADAGMYTFNFLATASKCGDGALDPLEFCDDGNAVATDGCDAKCEVMDGYTCDFSEPSVCMMDNTSAAPQVGDLVLNEFMAADYLADTNCDGSTTGTKDEFVELVNVSNKALNLEGVTIADSVVVRHTFGAVMLPAGEAVVVWNAGTPNIAGACAGVKHYDVASSGQLGLNDAGDTITIALGTTELIKVTYGQATQMKSFNLSPELMPNNDTMPTNYVLHDTLGGAQGAYSPGTKADGTAF